MISIRLSGLIILAITVASAGEFRVGIAQVDITPPLGTPMAGYYSERGATGTHDPLYAKAIVMEQDGKKVAMVVCDLITMIRQITEDARKRIESDMAIPGNAVMISATHSHTGPVLSGGSSRDPALGGNTDLAKEYRNVLPGKIAEAVKMANSRLQPVIVKEAIGHEDQLSFNRRFFMKDGSVGWNPGKLNSNIVKVAGPIDPAVPVVLFETSRGKSVGTYVNFAMHLDTVGGLLYSADYPYTLSKILADVKGEECLTVFSIGTAGDINHVNVSIKDAQKGNGEAARIGTILSAAVLKAEPKAELVKTAPPRSISKTVLLDLAHITDEDLKRASINATRTGKDEPKFLEKVEAFKILDVYGRQGKPWEVEVQAISIGPDLAWVSLPGEIFVEIGLAIKKKSPFKNTIIVELANTSIGYIPTTRAFGEGNYEPISARCAPGSGEKLVDVALDLLTKLKSD